MTPIKTFGQTHVFHSPRDWKQTNPGQECASLSVRAEMYGLRTSLASTWKPSADELKILNEGGAIELTLLTQELPPAALTAVPVAVEREPTIHIRDCDHYTHDRGISHDEHGPSTP